jgi:hypothetical protein
MVSLNKIHLAKIMKTGKIILILILLLNALPSAKSQTFTNACYVASTGRIWEATGGCGYYIVGCDSFGDFTTITSPLGATCIPCGGGPNGKRVTIVVTPCMLPLDDYVWVLMIGILGVLYFKRKNALNLALR